MPIIIISYSSKYQCHQQILRSSYLPNSNQSLGFNVYQEQHGPITDPCGTSSNSHFLLPTFQPLGDPIKNFTLDAVAIRIFRISLYMRDLIKGFSKVQKHKINIFPYINTTSGFILKDQLSMIVLCENRVVNHAVIKW